MFLSNIAASINSSWSAIVTKLYSDRFFINIIIVCAKITWWLKLLTSNKKLSKSLPDLKIAVFVSKEYKCIIETFKSMLNYISTFEMFKAEDYSLMGLLCPYDMQISLLR